jgi:hypothetical protein
MTHPDEELEPAEVTAIQNDAQEFVKSVVDYAQSRGREVAIISVSRVMRRRDSDLCAPGATAMVAERRAWPALELTASVLRKYADELDQMAARAPHAAISSYTQDKSDYTSDRKEWPQ